MQCNNDVMLKLKKGNVKCTQAIIMNVFYGFSAQEDEICSTLANRRREVATVIRSQMSCIICGMNSYI